MTLPDGFRWIKSNQNAPGGADVLAHGFRWVAQLYQLVDSDQWVARLDVQREAGGRPWKVRPCSSYQAGRAGIEAWARRHHERLVLETQQAERLNDATTIRFLQASLHKPRAKDPMKAWVHSAVREVASSRSGRER